MGNYMQILDVRKLLVQRGELMEVCSKETEGVYLRCDVSVTSYGQKLDQWTQDNTDSEMAQANPKPSYVDVP